VLLFIGSTTPQLPAAADSSSDTNFLASLVALSTMAKTSCAMSFTAQKRTWLTKCWNMLLMDSPEPVLQFETKTTKTRISKNKNVTWLFFQDYQNEFNVKVSIILPFKSKSIQLSENKTTFHIICIEFEIYK